MNIKNRSIMNLLKYISICIDNTLWRTRPQTLLMVTSGVLLGSFAFYFVCFISEMFGFFRKNI